MKGKIKIQKGFIQIAIPILIILLGVGGAFGILYYQSSGLIKEAEQLTIEEKYEEAINKLNLAQVSLLAEGLNINKRKIINEINENKKLLGDKSEYAQGIVEFNKKNWGKSKELLSKVSEISPYYEDTKNKIEEIKNNIAEEKVNALVAKATDEMQKQTAAARKSAEELQKELEKSQWVAKYLTTDTQLFSPVNANLIINNLKRGTKVRIVPEIHKWGNVKPGYTLIQLISPGEQNGQVKSEYLADSVTQSPDLASIVRQWRPRIAYIECEFRYSNGILYKSGAGSGFLVGNNIVTNKHIVTDERGYGAYYCVAKFPEHNNTYKFYLSNKEILAEPPGGYDIGYLPITYQDEYIKNLSSQTKSQFACSEKPSIGDEVAILGYPGIGSQMDITATKGIVSGYDDDYYITDAKIEQGNSGGAAILLKDNCYLGIPSYALVGKVESLARILDINVLYK